MSAPDLPPGVAAAEQQLAAYVALPPADQREFDALRAAVHRMQDRHDAEVRVAAYRECADIAVTGVSTCPCSACSTRRDVAEALRAHADQIAPES